MKRVLCLMLALLMTLSLAACGAQSSTGNGGVVESGKTPAKTNIMTSDQLAERDGQNQPSATEEPVVSDEANYEAVDAALLKVPLPQQDLR